MNIPPYDPFTTSTAALAGGDWLDSAVHNRACCGWCRFGWAAAQPSAPEPENEVLPGGLALGWSPASQSDVFAGIRPPVGLGHPQDPFGWSG